MPDESNLDRMQLQTGLNQHNKLKGKQSKEQKQM